MFAALQPAAPNAIVTLFRRDPSGRLVALPAMVQAIGGDVGAGDARSLWSTAVGPEVANTALEAVATVGGQRVSTNGLQPALAPSLSNALAPRLTNASTPANHAAPAVTPTLPHTFLARVTVQLTASPDVIGETPEGLRINFYLGGGTIAGPVLNGVVEPKGGDWMVIRRDGVGVPHIRAVIRLPDGALALAEYSGTFDLGPDGYEKAVRGVFPPAPPLALAPTFTTASTEWAWLNRLQCVGTGYVNMAQNLVVYDLFALTPPPGPGQTPHG